MPRPNISKVVDAGFASQTCVEIRIPSCRRKHFTQPPLLLRFTSAALSRGPERSSCTWTPRPTGGAVPFCLYAVANPPVFVANILWGSDRGIDAASAKIELSATLPVQCLPGGLGVCGVGGVCDTPPYRKTHDVVTVAPPRRRANCRPTFGAGAGVNGRARSRLRVALSRATPLYLVSPRDIRIRQPGAYSLPRDLETGHAVLKTGALPAIAVQRWLAVHIAAPRPLIDMYWKAGALHDSANCQATPPDGVVVGIAFPADLGGAHDEGFVVEHRLANFA